MCKELENSRAYKAVIAESKPIYNNNLPKKAHKFAIIFVQKHCWKSGRLGDVGVYGK